MRTAFSFQKAWLWILLIFLFKIAFLALFYSFFYPGQPGEMNGLVVVNKDFDEFFVPVKNLVEKGIYSFGGNEPYAGRMPGYFFPTVVLLFFFKDTTALHIMVVLQLRAFSVSLYYISIMLKEITKKKYAFPLTIIIFCL
ncbi:MAG: hypothetical protein IAF38_23135, partial [Bacteroidia bacterium]|nr:hypothetical protein [Bacteroidia bacterium]